jgi:hypothetical protein
MLGCCITRTAETPTPLSRTRPFFVSMAYCCDNAVVESVFGTLKRELVGHGGYPSRRFAAAMIDDCIDSFYKPKPRHSHLQYLSPIEGELRAQTAALAA